MDQKLDILTAIKVNNRKNIQQQQKNKLLLLIDVLSKLNQKNITKLLDKQKTSNNFYIDQNIVMKAL